MYCVNCSRADLCSDARSSYIIVIDKIIECVGKW